MYHLSELISKPVICVYDGVISGTLENVIFDKKLERIKTLIIYDEGTDTRIYLPVSYIISADKNAIMIKPPPPSAQQTYRQSLNPVMSHVYAYDGELISTLVDISLEEKFYTRQLLLANGDAITADRIVSYSGEALVICYDDEVLKTLKKSRPQKKRAAAPKQQHSGIEEPDNADTEKKDSGQEPDNDYTETQQGEPPNPAELGTDKSKDNLSKEQDDLEKVQDESEEQYKGEEQYESEEQDEGEEPDESEEQDSLSEESDDFEKADGTDFIDLASLDLESIINSITPDGIIGKMFISSAIPPEIMEFARSLQSEYSDIVNPNFEDSDDDNNAQGDSVPRETLSDEQCKKINESVLDKLFALFPNKQSEDLPQNQGNDADYVEDEVEATGTANDDINEDEEPQELGYDTDEEPQEIDYNTEEEPQELDYEMDEEPTLMLEAQIGSDIDYSDVKKVYPRHIVPIPNNLLGRKLFKDISDKAGNIIAFAGEEITQDIVEECRIHGKVVLLARYSSNRSK